MDDLAVSVPTKTAGCFNGWPQWICADAAEGFEPEPMSNWVAPPRMLDGGRPTFGPVDGPPGLAFARCTLETSGRLTGCRILKSVKGTDERVLRLAAQARLTPFAECGQAPDGGWVPGPPIAIPYTVFVRSTPRHDKPRR